MGLLYLYLLEDIIRYRYFGVDGEILHSSGLECGSVEGIYKHRHETMGFIEARSLIYESLYQVLSYS